MSDSGTSGGAAPFTLVAIPTSRVYGWASWPGRPGPPLVLHLGLEDVPPLAATLTPDARARGISTSRRRRTPRRSGTSIAVEHVRPTSPLQPVGDGPCPAARSLSHASPAAGRMAHQLMKRVQVTAGALDVFQRLGHRPRLDRLVADPVRRGQAARFADSLTVEIPRLPAQSLRSPVGVIALQSCATHMPDNPLRRRTTRSPRRCSTSASRR